MRLQWPSVCTHVSFASACFSFFFALIASNSLRVGEHEHEHLHRLPLPLPLAFAFTHSHVQLRLPAGRWYRYYDIYICFCMPCVVLYGGDCRLIAWVTNCVYDEIWQRQKLILRCFRSRMKSKEIMEQSTKYTYAHICKQIFIFCVWHILQFAKAAWSNTWRRKRHAPPATTLYINHTRCNTSALIAPCRTLCTNWCQNFKKVKWMQYLAI